MPHNYYTVSQRVPSNLDTAVPGAAPARRCGIVLSLKFSWRRIFFFYKAELQGVDCSGVQFLALPMITTMSNKDSSARMTGTFIIFILNLFLVVIREKRDLSQPSDSYIILIMNSQSRTRSRRAGPSQPGPARPCQGLKVDMRIALRRRGAADHQCWLVVLTLYMPCSCIFC